VHGLRRPSHDTSGATLVKVLQVQTVTNTVLEGVRGTSAGWTPAMGLLPSGKVRKGGSEGQMDVRESDEPRGVE
jgi:hypothetical protein